MRKGSKILVLLLIGTFYQIPVSTDTVPEFQFPCYVDVCTFPRQYCNSDRNERRCSPCTRSLCHETELPRACLYFCQNADRTLAPTLPVETTVAYPREQETFNIYYVYMIIFLAVTNTGIFVSLIFFILWSCHHRRKKQKPFTPMDRFVNDYRDIEEIEAPLLVNQRPKRQIPSRFELELRRLDSETKSLPPHAENQNELSKSSKSHTHSALSKSDGQSSTNVSEQSSAVSAQVNETDSDRSGPKLPVVVSPTRDSNSECHEKPWIKVGKRTLPLGDAGDQTFIKQ